MCVVTWIYVTINIKITFEASQAVLYWQSNILLNSVYRSFALFDYFYCLLCQEHSELFSGMTLTHGYSSFHVCSYVALQFHHVLLY